MARTKNLYPIVKKELRVEKAMYKVESIREIQQLELIIAKELKRICEENNIHYFLVGGTLLGSIRHKGFIPWDDDMDIGILYSDWEKFIHCARKSCRDMFYLEDWNQDSNFGYPFAKMRLKRTVMKEKALDDQNVNTGIWVDIFPYLPTDDAKISSNLKKLEVISKAYLLKVGYKLNLITLSWKVRCLNNLIAFLCMFVTKSTLRKKYDNLINNLISDNPTLYVELDGRFKGAFVFSNDIFNQFQLGAFEDTKFQIPAKWNEYLSKAYGDYMQLPPVEQREIGHSLVEVYLEEDISCFIHE